MSDSKPVLPGDSPPRRVSELATSSRARAKRRTNFMELLRAGVWRIAPKPCRARRTVRRGIPPSG
jgi:hypothetical protein